MKRLLIAVLVCGILLLGNASAAYVDNHIEMMDELFEQLLNASDVVQFMDINSQLEDMVAQRREQDFQFDLQLIQLEEQARAAFESKRQSDAKKTMRLAGANPRSSPPWDMLFEGDIMHINNQKYLSPYALYYSHSGIYNGDEEVYESVSAGVIVRDLAEWDVGNPVALGYANSLFFTERMDALEWAKLEYGTDGTTPYNWNFLDKNRDDALYCSQLVWKMHQPMGIDLDSNPIIVSAYLTNLYGTAGKTLAYLAVLPDEIYLSDEVTYFYAD